MSHLLTDLANMLGTTDQPGDFYTAGTKAIALPGLDVEGVGTIAFPLQQAQAEQLIGVAESSPYGRGEQTLHDPEVRRTWQIEPKRVQISGHSWPKTLEQIVEQAATGLGVSGSVQAEFYKLLVYDQGSFFIDHRDTEKSSGMFATLIIVLPSNYSGGDLLVRHRDREARLELQCPTSSDIAFAAFYADCVHAVLPIISGCRLTLVYNLLRQGSDQPEPPDYSPQQDGVAALIGKWARSRESSDDDGPEKLVYLLEHAYTQAELAFNTLKGADAAIAAVLGAAAPQADCELHLALLTIEQTGSAESNGYGWGRRGRWSEPEPDDDDFEIIEVDEETATLSDWRQVDGSPGQWGKLPCKEAELCPPTDFETLEPDEQHFHEASGNEGASFERSYRRAALVLWPRSRRLAVMNQAGLPATLTYLHALAQTWHDSGEDQASSTWRTAHELASHMMHSWPQRPHVYLSSPHPGQATEMLDCLMQLRDSAHIESFLNTISASGTYNEGDNQALVQAAALLPTAQAISSIERIIAANTATKLNACTHLLRLCSEATWLDGRPEQLIDIANTLVNALPGDPRRAPDSPSWSYNRDLNAGLVSNLLRALVRIDTGLAMQTADYLLAWPDTYEVDRVILPAILALYKLPAVRDSAPVQQLRSVCIAHLQARIAEALAAPGDWARAAKLSCSCTHCQELSQFLADPEQQVWIFKAAEAKRQHLERSARSNHCDLDLHTERRGRPHQLVCTKNQASYERRVRQREQDLKHLEQLEL